MSSEQQYYKPTFEINPAAKPAQKDFYHKLRGGGGEAGKVKIRHLTGAILEVDSVTAGWAVNNYGYVVCNG